MLFEVIKGIFFFMTIMVGLAFLRGKMLLGEVYYEVLKQVIIPGYLLFCGVMLGYIIAHLWAGSDEETPERRQIFIKSFLIGIGIGVLLSIIYMTI